VTREDDARSVLFFLAPSLSAHKLRSVPVEKTCLISEFNLNDDMAQHSLGEVGRAERIIATGEAM
jgi:hypothetical protein